MVSLRQIGVVAVLTLGLAGCGNAHRSSTGAATPATTAGAAARAYLRGDTPGLDVVVDHSPGLVPAASALDLLGRRLAERCVKPEGVRVTLGRELPPRETPWTEADTIALEAATRQEAAPGRARMRVLYRAGRSERDAHGETTLGWGAAADTFVVFGDTIRSHSPAVAATPAALEGAVFVHEAGHLLGLVGRCQPPTAPHEDVLRSSHCTARGCIMGAHTSDWGVLGNREPDFDPLCVADLRELGGK